MRGISRGISPKKTMCGRRRPPQGQRRDLVEAGVDGVVFDGRAAALALAARFGELSVHVDKVARAGALVQVVDVLRAEKVAAGELRFKLGERDVRGVGLSVRVIGAALGIEIPHQPWVALERFGCANLFDAMPRPEPV